MVTIKIVGLQKNYRKFQALQNVHLQIGTGLFGLLGPNGAGKSTIMKILSTSLPYSDGEVEIYDFNLLKEGDKIRKLLGYLPQDFHAPSQFTGKEFLHYVASMKGVHDRQDRIQQVEKVLADVNLLSHADKRIKNYSGGMRRRLGIAQALLGNPKLIILDEPTAGLDPSERIRFRNIIEKLSKNFTVILSTHIISDIESACKKVAVMNHGKVLFLGTTAELADSANDVVWELTVPYSEYDEVEREYVVVGNRMESDMVVFRIISKKAPFGHAKAVKPTIEDGYIAVIHGVSL